MKMTPERKAGTKRASLMALLLAPLLVTETTSLQAGGWAIGGGLALAGLAIALIHHEHKKHGDRHGQRELEIDADDSPEQRRARTIYLDPKANRKHQTHHRGFYCPECDRYHTHRYHHCRHCRAQQHHCPACQRQNAPKTAGGAG
ncbi:MAG TPA: hypothetical protein VJJ83_01985 [Candidatus Babeliales bacterium]|nr:hypothetical protein [Candidatus Babeliales bacterium]